MTIALFVVAVVFFATTTFLVMEFKKKFLFMQNFLANSPLKVTYQHRGNRFTRPSMKNIVLRSQAGQPFVVLVGFTLRIPIIGFEGFDYYGQTVSNENGVAVISTFVGRGDVEFVFVVNRNNEDGDITASLELSDQFLTPQVIYPPHWWQKLGFFS